MEDLGLSIATLKDQITTEKEAQYTESVKEKNIKVFEEAIKEN